MDLFDIIWLLIAAVFIAGPGLIGKGHKKSASGAGGRKPYSQTPPPIDPFPLPFPLPEEVSETTSENYEPERESRSQRAGYGTSEPIPAAPVSQARTDSAPHTTEVPVTHAEGASAFRMKATQPEFNVPQTSRVPASAKAPVEPENSEPGKKLKIDPEKMIIYSALMEPKFKFKFKS